MSMRSTLLILITAMVWVVTIPATASAAGWRALSDHAGRYTDEAGLVRGPDGALHVVYLDERGSNDVGIKYRTLSSTGALSDPLDVIGSWDSPTNPDIELIGGVPTAIWSGLNDPTPVASGELWMSTLGGAGWNPGVVIDAAKTAYLDNASTALDANGTLWTVFSQGVYGMFGHMGTDPLTVDANYLIGTCCQNSGNIERDAITGALMLNYYSNATGLDGYWSRQIAPTLEQPMLLPGQDPDESSIGHGARLAAAARTTGGVYSAYCDVAPSCTSIRVGARQTAGLVYKFPRGVTDPSTNTIWTAAAPSGRMWLSYATKNAVYITRSNRTLTVWGPTQKLRLPGGVTNVYNTAGNGSLGPLDLFANMETTGDKNNLNVTTVRAQLVVTPAAKNVSNAKANVVKLRVTDAGDIVPGAKIRFRGVTRTTNKLGYATFVIAKNTRPGFYPVTGSATGYVTGVGSVTVVKPRRPGK